MTPLVVGFAGHARSGKTSIAEAVAQRSQLPLASFGREVQREALERGLPLVPDDLRRKNLMAVGAQLIEQELEPFCRRVLQQGGWAPGRSLLVEGVRHAAAVHAIRSLIAPTEFHLVLVDTAAETREARLTLEGVVGPGARRVLDAHSTEREVSVELRRLSDLVVNGGGAVHDASSAVLAAMRSWGWLPQSVDS